MANEAEQVKCVLDVGPMDSLRVADSIIEMFLDNVESDRLDKMVELKKKPYVVAHTTLTGLMCVEMFKMKHDCKKDDVFISEQEKLIDLEEPPCLGFDVHWELKLMKRRAPDLKIDSEGSMNGPSSVYSAVTKGISGPPIKS